MAGICFVFLMVSKSRVCTVPFTANFQLFKIFGFCVIFRIPVITAVLLLYCIGVPSDYFYSRNNHIPHRRLHPAIPARDSQVAGAGHRKLVRRSGQPRTHHALGTFLRESCVQTNYLGNASNPN